MVVADFGAEEARASALAPRLIGLGEDDAERLAASEGCSIRVARRDGETFMLRLDYRPNRITIDVAAGKVVDAKARG